MTKIGPTFVDDLRAAGLDLAATPIAWTPDGEIIGRDGLTAEQSAKIDAALARHDPNKQASPPTVEQKLAAFGITLAELKAALAEV